MKQNFLLRTVRTVYRQGIRHEKYRWLIILGTLFYLASPLDIAPDVFPVLGWVDDGVIAALLITEVSQLMLEQLETQKKRNSSANSETAKIVDVEAVSIG